MRPLGYLMAPLPGVLRQEPLDHDGHPIFVVAGRHLVGHRLGGGVGVPHGDTEPRPGQHLAVVEPVAERHDLPAGGTPRRSLNSTRRAPCGPPLGELHAARESDGVASTSGRTGTTSARSPSASR